MPVELGLLVKINEQLKIKVSRLEAENLQLTEWCRDWRDHFEYMKVLRADVGDILEASESTLPDLDPEDLPGIE
jgi:hypothetical protein